MKKTNPRGHNTSQPQYNIKQLLLYNGPSSRLNKPFANSINIIDYKNSDQNEKVISVLLSSQKIPFYLDRPEKKGWSETHIRMILAVHENYLEIVQSILKAAKKESFLETVEGMEGLISF